MPAAETEIAGATAESAKIPMRCYSLQDEAGKRAPLYLLPGLDVEISASQIRELARVRGDSGKKGRAAGEELLPEAVSEYVQSHGLYR